MAVTTESPARIRAREIVIMVTNATGYDPAIDRALNQLFRFPHHHAPTLNMGDARRLVRRYRQWGGREYPNGKGFGAYVEVDSNEKRGFVWANHASETLALVLAALKAHISEMS